MVSNYSTSLPAVLISNARKACFSAELSDITFIVGKDKNEKEFPAIKLWFATQSSYFKELFITKKHDKATVIEQDITPLAFEYIYQYFYLQSPAISVNNVVEVIYAATKYSLDDVVSQCNIFMDSMINQNKIANILLFESNAIKIGLNIEHSVRQKFQKWLTVETSQQIVKSKVYLGTSQELLVYLIQNDSFSVPVM